MAGARRGSRGGLLRRFVDTEGRVYYLPTERLCTQLGAHRSAARGRGAHTVAKRVGAGPYDVVLCFCTDQARLRRRWAALHPLTTPAGALWIAWPKKAAKVPTDMTEHVVRDVALPLGLVDTKVCAIDDTWSGLKLVWRKDRR